MNLNKIIAINLFAILCCCKTNTVKTNCVSNSEDAVYIAEKEWLKTYGSAIYSKKPFFAELINDSIWIVKGTIKQDSLFSKRGGVPYIEISKKDCKIVKVTHGK